MKAGLCVTARADITKDSMRTAFAAYASDHEAGSIRRCWSTWNMLCTFLHTGEQLPANPMPMIGRPKPARSRPKALPRTSVEALLETVAQDRYSNRQTRWAERDLVLILTALRACLGAEELRLADIATSAPPTRAQQSSTSRAKAVRNTAYRWKANYSP